MGGLVTTYDAGMAVPDWPGTYGYNLFLYPPQSWLGVWDVFLEHSHRLLGAAVGLSSIGLAVLLVRYDGRRSVRRLGLLAVAGVCLQGTLGGLRVLGAAIERATICGVAAPLFLALAGGLLALAAQAVMLAPADRRSGLVWVRVLLIAVICAFVVKTGVAAADDKLLLAKLHGSTGPLVFGLAASLVTLTSRRWLRPGRLEALGPEALARARKLERLALPVAVAIYLQIVLGVQLRHVPPAAAHWWFTLWVWLHLITAGVVLLGVIWIWISAERIEAGDAFKLTRRVRLLAVLFLLQLVLGAATWVTNFGWPRWFTDYLLAAEYTIVAEGFWQVIVTTAHVATGSLNLAAAVTLVLWLGRPFPREFG
jgi:cytochrome c oxidase assembly protein subunit 15